MPGNYPNTLMLRVPPYLLANQSERGRIISPNVTYQYTLLVANEEVVDVDLLPVHDEVRRDHQSSHGAQEYTVAA